MGYAKLKDLRGAMREQETALYHLSTKRFEAVRAFEKALAAAAWENLPYGVMQASARSLRDPRSTFLVVRTHQPSESIHRGTTSATTVGMRREDGKVIAFDAATGEALGEMNEMGANPRDSWPYDFIYSGNPIREAAFTDLAFGSPDPKSSLPPHRHALPLDGPLLAHPAFGRAAAVARRILDNQFDALQVVRAVDRETTKVKAAEDALQAKARAVMDAAVARVRPQDADPRLTGLVSTMDWTFDYADRTRSEDYAQRDAIRRGLNAMPADDAVAYVGMARQWGWTYALSLLRDHPDAQKKAA